MNKIKSLDSKLVNQIAAGEVIDRPSSVIKELIENSIDAKSNLIEIIVEKGGNNFIQVTDNGCGMSKEDLKLSFKRHATSKIKSLDDLNNIESLGFRGEALPSIASVSMVTAISAESDNNGYQIKIHGNEEISFKPYSSLKGSTLIIKNLFFNTPARRKFLKKPETEQAIINSIVRRFMISRPDISFKLISNNKTIYDISSESLENRIMSIFGSSYSDSILPIKNKKDLYSVNGYVGNLSIIKKRPTEQYLFINGRYIKDRLLTSAITSAYKTLIQRGEFPFFILFLNMPTTLFDINVHPAKLEAKFINEWQVYHVIKSSVKLALNDILKVIPQYNFNLNAEMHKHIQSEKIIFENRAIDDIPYLEKPAHNRLSSYSNEKDIENIFNKEINNPPSIPKDELDTVTDHIWQIHNKYLLTEIKNGLIIIDQHVAHERVLFENAKKAINGGGLPSQTILFPQTIQLLPEEFDCLTDISIYLEKIGFKFRSFGKNTIIVEGIPQGIVWGTESTVIKEIIDQYISIKKIDPSFVDQISAIYACKSAIKAGDKLEPEERIHLVDQLFSTEHPYYCPHGRPIIINLSIEDLDRRFERL